MKQMPLIYSVIITFNPMQWIDRCLQSLLTSDSPKPYILVVDNASTDGCVDYISEHYPDVKILLPGGGGNLGFAKASNLGMRRALDEGADYVFLLNQDAWVEKNTLGTLVACCEKDKTIGIISPMQMNGGDTAFDRIFASYLPSKFYADSFRGVVSELYDMTRISAASWLMPIATLRKVGGFDTDIFVHYGEDRNYLNRVLFMGLRACVCTSCIMCHDREMRSVAENTERYKRFNISQQFVSWLIKTTNVNVNFNGGIIYVFHSICSVLNRFLFRCSEAAVHKAKSMTVKKIQHSRKMYKKGGLLWL